MGSGASVVGGISGGIATIFIAIQVYYRCITKGLKKRRGEVSPSRLDKFLMSAGCIDCDIIVCSNVYNYQFCTCCEHTYDYKRPSIPEGRVNIPGESPVTGPSVTQHSQPLPNEPNHDGSGNPVTGPVMEHDQSSTSEANESRRLLTDESNRQTEASVHNRSTPFSGETTDLQGNIIDIPSETDNQDSNAQDERDNPATGSVTEQGQSAPDDGTRREGAENRDVSSRSLIGQNNMQTEASVPTRRDTPSDDTSDIQGNDDVPSVSSTASDTGNQINNVPSQPTDHPSTIDPSYRNTQSNEPSSRSGVGAGDCTVLSRSNDDVSKNRKYDIFLYYRKNTDDYQNSPEVKTLQIHMNQWRWVSLDTCALGWTKTNFVQQVLEDRIPVVVVLLSEVDCKQGNVDLAMEMVIEEFNQNNLSIVVVRAQKKLSLPRAWKGFISASLEDEDFNRRFIDGIRYGLGEGMDSQGFTKNEAAAAVGPPVQCNQSVFPVTSRSKQFIEHLAKDIPGRDWKKIASDKLGASSEDLELWKQKEPTEAAHCVLDEWDQKGLTLQEFIDYSKKLGRQSLIDAATVTQGIDETDAGCSRE